MSAEEADMDRLAIVDTSARRGWRDFRASPLGLYRILGALIIAGLVYALAQLLKLGNAMTWPVFLLTLLACAIWLVVDVVFYFGRAAIRERRGDDPAPIPADTLRRMRNLAQEVKEYLDHIRAPVGLDEFTQGGRNAPGWTGPEQWLFLSQAIEIVKGQWTQEHEVEVIRDSDMAWPRQVLTSDDDAIRLREQTVWRMERLLKFLTKGLG
jgi:hypothetical protein